MVRFTVLPNEALNPFLKPAIGRIEILLQRGREIRMDFISRRIEGILQISQKPLTFTSYGVGVNLTTCVLEGKNTDTRLYCFSVSTLSRSTTICDSRLLVIFRISSRIFPLCDWIVSVHDFICANRAVSFSTAKIPAVFLLYLCLPLLLRCNLSPCQR